MVNKSTDSKSYANRLKSIQGRSWKRFVPNPYKWHIRAAIEAPTLEVGCGIGRVLSFAPAEIEGVDHNPHSIEECRKRGLVAFTTTEFFGSDPKESYNSLLFSHILEHMTKGQAASLIADYLPYLKPGGKVILVCPQEVGFDSDETHVEFMDFVKLKDISKDCGLELRQSYSFPFPRFVGSLFIYNEFVLIAEKPHKS